MRIAASSRTRDLPTPALIRVMGIDPGTETTGYGVIDCDGRGYSLVECGGIRASGRSTFAEKLLAISTELEETISRLKPSACAVEETFYAVNVKSALKLGHARGVVLVAAARSGVPVFEYSALAIKSAVVGYGRADKQQVQEMVRRLLGLKLPPQPPDAADALAAAICHSNMSATLQRMNAT